MSTPAVNSFLIFFILLLNSCGPGKKEEKDGEVLAEAYGESLSRSEMWERMPASITEQDSERVAETAVRNWVRERVLIRMAEDELSADQKDLRKRIEAYRRSLMIHLLERDRVKEELDSNVKDQEIETYYRENKKEFVLDEAIMKSVHVQLKKDSVRYLPRFMRALRKDSAERSELLRPLCREHALRCDPEAKEWVRLQHFLTRSPIDIDDRGAFLEKRRVQRYDKEDRIFLIRILDHRSVKDTAPPSMVKGRVKRMIINDRKRAIVDRLHKNAFLDARKNDKVRIH
jgi:hypothetical protein